MEKAIQPVGQTFAGLVNANAAHLQGFTEENQFRIRFPREGKIHLGVKVPMTKRKSNGEEYQVEAPRATNYFVLDPKLLADEEFLRVLEERGEAEPGKPKAIPVWLPSNNIVDNLQTSYDRYSKTRGLLCRSTDGITARCRNEETLETVDQPCLNKDCPHFKKGECFVMHRLRVMLPDAMGIGVWQIDTKSDNNWGNLSSEMTNIRGWTGGKLAGVDLVLTLEPAEKQVTFEGRDKKLVSQIKIVHLLHLHSGYKLRDLRREAAKVQVDWEMSDIAEVDTDYDDVAAVEEQAPPVNDGDFVVGEPPVEDAEYTEEAPVDAPELHDALLNSVRQALDTFPLLQGKSDELKAAFCRRHVKGLKALDDLGACSVDQLQALADELAEKTGQ